MDMEQSVRVPRGAESYSERDGVDAFEHEGISLPAFGKSVADPSRYLLATQVQQCLDKLEWDPALRGRITFDPVKVVSMVYLASRLRTEVLRSKLSPSLVEFDVENGQCVMHSTGGEKRVFPAKILGVSKELPEWREKYTSALVASDLSNRLSLENRAFLQYTTELGQTLGIRELGELRLKTTFDQEHPALGMIVGAVMSELHDNPGIVIASSGKPSGLGVERIWGIVYPGEESLQLDTFGSDAERIQFLYSHVFDLFQTGPLPPDSLTSFCALGARAGFTTGALTDVSAYLLSDLPSRDDELPLALLASFSEAKGRFFVQWAHHSSYRDKLVEHIKQT